MSKLETKHLIGLENISKKDIDSFIDVGFTFRGFRKTNKKSPNSARKKYFKSIF